MRVGTEKNVTIFAGQSAGNAANAKETEKNVQRKSVYAGDTKLAATRDLIGQRKAKAQKDAMKVVGDTFDAEKALDDDMEARREKVRALKNEKLENQGQINWFSEEQERLQKEYGVSDDSEEQKELELLRKCKDPQGGATKEEREQADKIRQKGLTEYQSRQLEIDDEKKRYQERNDRIDQEVEQENRTIEAMRLERLKSSPMVKAQKEADAIREAASQEIIGMVVDDAREHVDEEVEKREEKAEKIKVEREKQEELIERRKEKREEMEELIEEMPMEEMLRLDRYHTNVDQEVQEILQKMKLVPEDIKGAAVDEKL